MNSKLTIILSVVLILGLLLSGCGSTSGPSDGGTSTTGTNVGDMAPDFQLQSLGGQSYSLSDLLGQPVMLNFWASWCGPCVHEMPYIQQIYDEWSGAGLVLLAINYGESSSEVRTFIESRGYSFPVLLDTSSGTGQEYRIMGIPTTFFIDGHGVIQDKVVGSFPNKEAIEEHLDKIMP